MIDDAKTRMLDYWNPRGGGMGASKSAMRVALIHESYATERFKRLHTRDISPVTQQNGHLWRGMQVAMCLEKLECLGDKDV